MSRPPVVDMCGIVYDAECWAAYRADFAEYAPSYVRALGPRLAAAAAAPADLDAYAARLRAENVRAQVIMGGMRRLPDGGTVNDRVAGFGARYPDLLLPWANVNLADPAAAIAEVRRCVADYGVCGASVSHFLDVADPTSAGAHEFYAAVAELGRPLWIHSGHNLSTRVPMDWCAWRQLDEIARRHPDLTLIAGHGGWPWVLETLALCQRHPNVYLEFSTHRPRHLARAGSGWEPLFALGTSSVRHKVLFGSVEWAHGLSTGTLADEVAALDVDERSRAAWLHDNAARLLGLS